MAGVLRAPALLRRLAVRGVARWGCCPVSGTAKKIMIQHSLAVCPLATFCLPPTQFPCAASRALALLCSTAPFLVSSFGVGSSRFPACPRVSGPSGCCSGSVCCRSSLLRCSGGLRVPPRRAASDFCAAGASFGSLVFWCPAVSALVVLAVPCFFPAGLFCVPLSRRPFPGRPLVRRRMLLGGSDVPLAAPKKKLPHLAVSSLFLCLALGFCVFGRYILALVWP